MNLVIDIGNTRIKIAFFDQNRLVRQANLPLQSLEPLLEAAANAPAPVQQGIVTSTSKPVESVIAAFEKKFPIIALQHNTPIPIENNYKTPQTLGKDRLAAVIGASVLHPKQNDMVNEVFSPTTQEYEDSKNFLRLYAEAQKINKGVAIIEGKFVGPPLITKSNDIIARVELIERRRKQFES